MSLQFVNIHGEPVGTSGPEIKRKRRDQPDSFHNGWRVVGIPPGELEAARDSHERVTRFAQTSGGRMPKPWDEAHWLMNARKKAVRSKPYEVPAAAQSCAALAEKSGWLRVEVVELKKEPQPAA